MLDIICYMYVKSVLHIFGMVFSYLMDGVVLGGFSGKQRLCSVEKYSIKEDKWT